MDTPVQCGEGRFVVCDACLFRHISIRPPDCSGVGVLLVCWAEPFPHALCVHSKVVCRAVLGCVRWRCIVL